MSEVMSFRPSHGTLNQRCSTSISWDDGKEIRIYHLGVGNVLQEYAYSAIMGWRYGSLHHLKIVLDPTSSLAAIRSRFGSIVVYYQGPNDDIIRQVYQKGLPKSWEISAPITRAVKGSSIAVVYCGDADTRQLYSIFYQDPKLRIREYTSRSGSGWAYSDFNPGVQPRGTPISAEAVHGGDVEINVMWRDAHGRAVSGSWSKSSGWDLPNRPNDRNEILGGPASLSESLSGLIGSVNYPLATVSWENGKEIRIYYLDSDRTLQEYAYSEKKGRDCWYYGDLFKLRIILSPNSVIVAIRFNDEIRIYYQDGGLGIIQELCKPPLTDSWVKGASLAEGAESSKIAVIGWTDNGKQIRVYYQDPHLHLQERRYDNACWTRGAFNPGPQPRGTPIVAEVAHIGYPAIQVSWKNASGWVVSSRCDKDSRWDTHTAENRDSNGSNLSQLDGSG